MQADPSPNPDASREKHAKLARGCGGCGCALAVLLLLGGGVLVALGTQSHTTEAMPFGIASLVAFLPAALLGAVLLYWGISTLKKSTRG